MAFKVDYSTIKKVNPQIKRTLDTVKKEGLYLVANQTKKEVAVGLADRNYNFAKYFSNLGLQKSSLGIGKNLEEAITNLFGKLKGKELNFFGIETKKFTLK